MDSINNKKKTLIFQSFFLILSSGLLFLLIRKYESLFFGNTADNLLSAAAFFISVLLLFAIKQPVIPFCISLVLGIAASFIRIDYLFLWMPALFAVCEYRTVNKKDRNTRLFFYLSAGFRCAIIAAGIVKILLTLVRESASGNTDVRETLVPCTVYLLLLCCYYIVKLFTVKISAPKDIHRKNKANTKNTKASVSAEPIKAIYLISIFSVLYTICYLFVFDQLYSALSVTAIWFFATAVGQLYLHGAFRKSTE